MYEGWENSKRLRKHVFLRLELAFIGKSEPYDNYIFPPLEKIWDFFFWGGGTMWVHGYDQLFSKTPGTAGGPGGHDRTLAVKSKKNRSKISFFCKK